MSSARNAGESAICRLPAQPSAEIVRVECAKCRRECDLSGPRATLCGVRACRVREMQARVRFAGCPRKPLRRSCVSRARNAGESAICPVRAQPSAEIVRVECAKCRRECDLSGPRATLCGDRACRVREMQARVRFTGCPRNPLRRSCASSARNAGESAICPVRAQPSAEIVRVECAKCRRACELPAARATLCGDRARRVLEMQARVRFAGCPRNPLQNRACRVRKMQARARFVKSPRDPLRRSCVSSARNAGESAIRAEQAVELEAENWRLCSATLVRGGAGELEAENWRRGSTTVVRGVAGVWEDENWRLGSTTLVCRVAGEREDENWRVGSTT